MTNVNFIAFAVTSSPPMINNI